jgi:hypothetical protein
MPIGSISTMAFLCSVRPHSVSLHIPKALGFTYLFRGPAERGGVEMGLRAWILNVTLFSMYVFARIFQSL